MDTAEIFVTLGGLLAIAWVVWFFFLGERERTVAAVGATGAQEVKILVKGGYDPDVVVVRQGRPVRLEFYRDETAGCSDTVVLGDFGIARPLPPYQSTVVELTPERAGEFTFTCGMNMLRGKLIVEPAGEGE
ncbi:MAG: cupredoxin domain-containing protein [Armatimonadota bacterium]